MSILTTSKPDIASLPGGWEPTEPFELTKKNAYCVDHRPLPDVVLVQNYISADDADRIVDYFKMADRKEAVSIQGRTDVPDDRIGSVRTTAWAPAMAQELWDRMKYWDIFKTKQTDRFSHTDHWQKVTGEVPYQAWEPIGITPMLRYMEYEAGGEHYAHYDAGFIYPNPIYRTLKSFVLYLTTNDTGATRLIRDGQDKVPTAERDHDDWTRPVTDDEVIYSSLPIKGSLLSFNHRMCHDVARFDGPGKRIIIRGDVLYKAIQ